jgi:hypothetical protein
MKKYIFIVVVIILITGCSSSNDEILKQDLLDKDNYIIDLENQVDELEGKLEEINVTNDSELARMQSINEESNNRIMELTDTINEFNVIKTYYDLIIALDNFEVSEKSIVYLVQNEDCLLYKCYFDSQDVEVILRCSYLKQFKVSKNDEYIGLTIDEREIGSEPKVQLMNSTGSIIAEYSFEEINPYDKKSNEADNIILTGFSTDNCLLWGTIVNGSAVTAPFSIDIETLEVKGYTDFDTLKVDEDKHPIE